MKGCVPTGGVLCASLELLPSANLEWIMEEDKLSVASLSRTMLSVMSSMYGGSVTAYQRLSCLNTMRDSFVFGDTRVPTAPSRRRFGSSSNVFPLNVQSICVSFFLCCGVELFSCSRPVVFVRPVSALWAGDGVARACAVPFEDEVERVPSVVWCAGVVCFVPVDVV